MEASSLLVSCHTEEAFTIQPGTQLPPVQSSVSQFSKFSGYWEPQEVHSGTPDPWVSQMSILVALPAFLASRWQNE